MSLEHAPARAGLERINRYNDLEERGFGSRTTIWRKVRDGSFPAPEMIWIAPVGANRSSRPTWNRARRASATRLSGNPL